MNWVIKTPAALPGPQMWALGEGSGGATVCKKDTGKGHPFHIRGLALT